jgi:hypothetical protein
MTDQREDEPLVDADDFVGEPPAGDAKLDDFVSNDQSAPAGEQSDDKSGGKSGGKSDGRSDDDSEDES